MDPKIIDKVIHWIYTRGEKTADMFLFCFVVSLFFAFGVVGGEGGARSEEGECLLLGG
jgi:hypothetical protein